MSTRFGFLKAQLASRQLTAAFAAPTGGSKLTFPFNNSLVSVANGKAETSRAEKLYFVGNRDNSTLMRSTPYKMGCIGVEFWPHGAFPVFGVPMGDASNVLWRGECSVR